MPTLALLLLLLSVESSCERHALRYSPDRKHAVEINYYERGALGADFVKIYVRTRWSPISRRVFFGEGEWDFGRDELGSPEVKWLGNTNLFIGYDGEHDCPNRIGDVQITCAASRSLSP